MPRSVHDFMYFLVYDIVTSLLAPPGALWLSLRRKHRSLLGRFCPLQTVLDTHPLWVQACSVGEVTTAKPLLAALAETRPDIPVLLTTSTEAGRVWARQACPTVPVAWFPFDHRLVVRRFLAKAQPRALVLVETEIWPNVIRLAHRRSIPVLIVNGRLSDKHFLRYKRLGFAMRSVFARLAGVGAQNDEYAARFRSLGVPEEVVTVTGNTKFDGVRTEGGEALRASVFESNRLSQDAPILLFGSTRPGDEALAASCWKTLRDKYPDMTLIVAPRHPDRVPEVAKLFAEPLILRSEIKAGKRRSVERILIVDTLGELAAFYATATVAVIGGSFYPGVNGHNPLEAAGLGIPTVFGPYMRNFIDPARVLTEARGAVQTRGTDDLCPTLDALLADPSQREGLGQRGRAAILANQGALRRTLQFLEKYVSFDQVSPGSLTVE